MKSGKLSQFYSAWEDEFYGGNHISNFGAKIIINKNFKIIKNFTRIN